MLGTILTIPTPHPSTLHDLMLSYSSYVMSDRHKQLVVEEGMVRLVLVNMNIQGTLMLWAELNSD